VRADVGGEHFPHFVRALARVTEYLGHPAALLTHGEVAPHRERNAVHVEAVVGEDLPGSVGVLGIRIPLRA
jgi:hypothetical protein